MFMMERFFVLMLGLLSTTMAGVIYSRGGETFCSGMTCPPNTGCSIVSNHVNGVEITKTSCFNFTGHIVKEQITEEGGDSVFFSDGTMTCTITTSDIDGQVNTTKQCRDENGRLRPMTPEEEAEFERRISEAEAAGRKAKRLYEVGMRSANESIEEALRLTAAAQKHARRLRQQAVDNEMMIAQRMHHMSDHRDRKIQRQHENWARRLKEGAARRAKALEEAQARSETALEEAQARSETALEEAQARREMAEEERERRLEEAQARREMAQAERERRLEEAQARRERKEQQRERKIRGYLPYIVDSER